MTLIVAGGEHGKVPEVIWAYAKHLSTTGDERLLLRQHYHDGGEEKSA